MRPVKNLEIVYCGTPDALDRDISVLPGCAKYAAKSVRARATSALGVVAILGISA